MSLYRSCAYCGASLDPSEICDCQIELSELEERTSCKTHSLQKKKGVEEDNLKKYIRNQLIRCPCGNILAGYDGHNLTIRKKGRSVAVASCQANIEITCEDCGCRIDVLLDGQADHPCSVRPLRMDQENLRR